MLTFRRTGVIESFVNQAIAMIFAIKLPFGSASDAGSAKIFRFQPVQALFKRLGNNTLHLIGEIRVIKDLVKFANPRPAPIGFAKFIQLLKR